MNKIYTDDKIFERQNFLESDLPKGEYNNCTFINCVFTYADLSGINFEKCIFNGCDLSNAKLNKTSLQEVFFNDCKMLGLHFQNCNDFLFSVNFENCKLKLASFYRVKLKKMTFKNCELQEVDFTESDLSSAVINNCDLSGAIFESSILEKADFRLAYNYSINPELNKMKGGKFSVAGIAGLLDKYQIEISN